MGRVTKCLDKYLPPIVLADTDRRYRGRVLVALGFSFGLIGLMAWLVMLTLEGQGIDELSFYVPAFLFLIFLSPYALKFSNGFNLSASILVVGYVGVFGTLMMTVEQLYISLIPALFLAPVMAAYFLKIRVGLLLLIVFTAVVAVAIAGDGGTSLPQGPKSTELVFSATLLGAVMIVSAVSIGFIGSTRRALMRGLEMEERTRQHQARLAQFARLSSVGEMASGMAHELNQPLTAITGYVDGSAQRLRNATHDKDEVLEALKKASDQAIRAGDIIRRIRAFVRPSDDVREVIDLNSVIRDILVMLEYEARRGNMTINLQLDATVPHVRGDAIQIQQVVLNLARNAQDAIREGSNPSGIMAIRTENSANGFVEVRVEDDGLGITSETRDRMFEPFYTTKEQGLGMGLSICQSIVEGHGGRIWVDPDDRAGAVVFFSLPMFDGDTHVT